MRESAPAGVRKTPWPTGVSTASVLAVQRVRASRNPSFSPVKLRGRDRENVPRSAAMAHGQHAPRRARLGRRNGCASGREAAGQIRQELGHYAVGRVEGQLGPRRANLVPKYYGVNTVDEILTAGGDDWHRPKFPVTPEQRPVRGRSGKRLGDSSRASRRQALQNPLRCVGGPAGGLRQMREGARRPSTYRAQPSPARVGPGVHRCGRTRGQLHRAGRRLR